MYKGKIDNLDELIFLSIEELLDRFPELPNHIPDGYSNFDASSPPSEDIDDEDLFDFDPDYSAFENSNNLSRIQFNTSSDQFANTTPFEFEALIKGMKKELNPDQQLTLNASLLDLPRQETDDQLTKANKFFEKEWLDENGANWKRYIRISPHLPFVLISKNILDFGLPTGQLAPLHRQLKDSFTIKCLSGKVQFTILPGKPAKTHNLIFEPQRGIVKKKKPLTIDVGLTIRTTLSLRQIVCIDVDGVGRFFHVISLDSEKSVFGVDSSELPLIEDNGWNVPLVLATMRRYLQKSGGYYQEGIFRLAGNDSENSRIKEKLNTEEFTDCSDLNCIADLIKIWFRELPEPILNCLPVGVWTGLESDEECTKIIESIKEPNKTLLLWLLDLMHDIVDCESSNKMGARNLAIVISPNLFTTPQETSVMDSLVLSQRIVGFVMNALQLRMKTRSEFLIT